MKLKTVVQIMLLLLILAIFYAFYFVYFKKNTLESNNTIQNEVNKNEIKSFQKDTPGALDSKENSNMIKNIEYK